MANVIPPAAPFQVANDDRFQGYSDTLFGTQEEYTSPIKCDVVGKMPDWLHGSFIRVGAGRFKWGDTECGHWFDGDAIAHKFTIDEGKVVYQNKFLRTEYRRKNEKHNRISTSGFGTWAPPDPCANIFRRIAMYFIPHMKNDNAGVNVFTIQGKTYVATETPWMVEINKETLDTIKIINARKKLSPATASWLAHPHFEKDGSTLFFNTIQGSSPKYELVSIPPTPGSHPLDGMKVFASLECGPNGAGYYHSFAVTDNYVILVENPLMLDGLCSLLTMNICRKSFIDILSFKPEYGTRFRVIDKRSGKELRECVADAFFVFHHANAFEKDGELVLDMCAHPDDTIIGQFYMKNCFNDFQGLTIHPPNLVRYRIPLEEIMKTDPEPYRFPLIGSEGKDHEVLAPSVEGPVINYSMVNGKEYSYVFGISDFIYTPRLVKVDVNKKTCTYWTPPEKAVPSIPHFIANPNGKEEDDGVLVTNCTGVNGVESFLVVLDGKTMKEVARAIMSVSMCFGLHANFFQGD